MDVVSRDPRPDLADSALFSRLLAEAYALDGGDPAGLFGALHYVRCGGARVAFAFDKARLVAGGCDDYDAVRARCLLPRAAELRRLLAGLNVVHAGDVSQGHRA